MHHQFHEQSRQPAAENETASGSGLAEDRNKLLPGHVVCIFQKLYLGQMPLIFFGESHVQEMCELVNCKLKGAAC
jgi:hypothetical protein